MEEYENWWEEKRSAYIYAIMSQNEANVMNKKLFAELEIAAEKQAALWEEKLRATKPTFPPFVPDLRTRIVSLLIKTIGTRHISFILSAMKIRGMSVFGQNHTEHRHTPISTASNLRAAVFGITDGMVSNLSLILGMAGASSSSHTIIIAGIAGLLAGACSMGAGEYISVRSQSEVLERQMEIERQELKLYPEEEKEELALIYEARGLPGNEARHLANLMINNPATGLSTLAREELGINPNDLASPVGAMLSSFFAFAIGAAIPLLPYLLAAEKSPHLLYSIFSTSIFLFFIGSILSLFTNRNPIFLGLRMLCIGAIAGGLTYLIGTALGVVL